MGLFASKIHQLREDKRLYQRKLAEVLSIDTPMYCRIEKGERRAKREQIPVIAEILNADPEELLALWLADQVTAVVADETNIAKRVLKIADKSLDKK